MSTTRCFYNHTKQDPSVPYIDQDWTGNDVLVNDCFCIASFPKDRPSPTNNTGSSQPDVYYLATPPLTAPTINAEPFFSPNSTNGICSSYPNGPDDCANTQSGYCLTPDGQIEALACNNENSTATMMQGCQMNASGGYLQLWQCVPSTWDCVSTSARARSCEINYNGNGAFTSKKACRASNCENCANNGYCNGRGSCANNICYCTGGYFTDDCTCPPLGTGQGGCDWPDLNTLEKCGDLCQSANIAEDFGRCLPGWLVLNVSRGNCPPFGGCFRSGGMVLLQDNTGIAIQDTREGQKIITVQGTVATIESLRSHNIMPSESYWYGINDDDPFFTSNHPLLTFDGKWVALNPQVANQETPGLACEKMKVGQSLRKWQGSKYQEVVIKRITIDVPKQNEKMYELNLIGGDSYHINGYAVKMISLKEINQL